MRRCHRPLVLFALAASLAVATPGRAADTPPVSSESRLGVIMAAACGIAVRYALTAPSPFTTAASVYTCGFALLDALVTPDNAP